MTPQSKKELEKILREDTLLFMKYQRMEERWKNRFCDYFAGVKTLPFTYDPFFNKSSILKFIQRDYRDL